MVGTPGEEAHALVTALRFIHLAPKGVCIQTPSPLLGSTPAESDPAGPIKQCALKQAPYRAGTRLRRSSRHKGPQSFPKTFPLSSRPSAHIPPF